MPTEFVHLHVHTDYSLLDGACSIYHKDKNRKDLIKLAAEFNMPAIAITDHGVMGGAMDFYQNLKANSLKPIIGCEMYVSPTTHTDRDQRVENIRGFHLILLAKDFKGYQNLCKLNSIANLKGVYYKPRVDKELLAEYSEGLIALTACLHGEVSHYIMKGKIQEAKKHLSAYLDIYGKENLYLEIQDHGIPEQKIVNRGLVELSKEFSLELVATNDAHYLLKEHSRSHEIMLCIQTNALISEEKRFKFPNNEFYFKSGDEMLELFKDVPSAITNTLSIAEKCNLEIPFVPDVNHYPVYELPSGTDEKEYLRNICIDSMQDRYDFDPRTLSSLNQEQKEIMDRMDFELSVIGKTNYCSYFLVVWDFLKHARSIKVPVGPGRGSGAGSIVAYLTYITDIDPIKYNLLFERFLNPDRVSPPDFDIDFCERRRIEVIQYVKQKYGEDSVAQIGTYGTLKAKAVIKDVGRVLGHSFDQRNIITKLMPNDPKLTLASSQQDNDDLKRLMQSEEWVREIFTYSEPLEGLNRNMSMHAAGVIIGDQPLDNLVPLSRGAKDEIITQYPAAPCEAVGLLKMDFLGLKTLTIIQDAIDIIKANQNIEIDISEISLEDTKTFDLLNKGETIGVFQLESGGMRDLCKKFCVDRLEDIIALIALYRPGPMQFIGDYINRKTGKIKIEYDHPKMEDVLKETYGIMLYQEQIMQVVQVLAGFTLGGADILRRAIGKKKIAELTAQKKKFVEGCNSFNGINEETANAIWDKIELFAGYGFNKSHSAAYAFLAYRTAYLKANFPVEFMTAVLTSEINKADELAFFIKECKDMGIPLLPPDVNISTLNFTADGDKIRFGLAAIKNVGESASKSIIAARETEGKFKSLTDFAERGCDSLTTRVIENLIMAGALDSFGLYKSQLLEVLPDYIAIGQQKAKDKKAGQGNLFDFFASEENLSSDNKISDQYKISEKPEMPIQEILKAEKELLGFYVSGHPLNVYENEIKKYSTHNIAEIRASEANNIRVRIGGLITNLTEKISKKNGSKFAIFHLEDLTSSIETMVFSRTFEAYKELVQENSYVYIEGNVNSRDEEESKKITVDTIYSSNEVIAKFTEELHVYIKEENYTKEKLKELAQLIKESPGDTRLVICAICNDSSKYFIETGLINNLRLNNEIIANIEKTLGKKSCKFKASKLLTAQTGKTWGNKYKKNINL